MPDGGSRLLEGTWSSATSMRASRTGMGIPREQETGVWVLLNRGPMPDAPTDVARDALRAALTLARSARSFNPAPLEAPVRQFARAYREASISVAECLVEVKHMLRELTDRDAPIYTPHVVGWTVRGYYEGTPPKAGGEPGRGATR